ncbi:MAG: hypothetical protein DK306_002404, partial [Chloroflexi bacterium]
MSLSTVVPLGCANAARKGGDAMGDFADYVRLLAGPRASTGETGRAFLRAATETVLASY